MKRGQKAQPATKWRTAAQERVYGRRLLEALRTTAALGPRAVKEAADSALALTARGRSRWSRAILLRTGRKIRRGRRRARAAEAAGGRVRGRLRVLRRLVPGCRNLSAGSLLEEAADYVAALEMQVKAMRALADALSAAPEAAAASEPGSRGGV
ncbi:hypothetical protein BHE74_00016349 [Ensete ventricosum]|nr:hypothetical protein GW17_00000949 [Ensete ventricosum]RWW75610.1 hypothetical protein BHE74_00016349 [Ensete ventricosum]RZR95771.1 hypothetical protein BHM03_00024667 [Ensete ventricosum]